MSWWTYVQRVAPDAQQAEIAKASGVTPSTVSRWKHGAHTPDPQAVASFARSYGRPVLEALVEAGFLTPAEAKQRPSAPPSYDSLTNEQLIRLVFSRMNESHDERPEAGHGEPANDRAGVRPADQWIYVGVSDVGLAADSGGDTERNRRARRRQADAIGEESQE